MDTPTKCCSKCGKEFPWTREFFNWQQTHGIKQPCIECRREGVKVSNASRKTQRAAYAREYRAKHRDHLINYQRDYYRNNRERELKYAQQYRIGRKEHDRKYNEQYRAMHRDIYRLAGHRYRTKKRDLPDSFTQDDWNSCLKWWDSRCAYCGNPPGLFNSTKICADHWIPLDNPDCPGTIPANILPACMSCNSQKINKSGVQWVTAKFGKHKAKQILAHIDAYFDSLKE